MARRDRLERGFDEEMRFHIARRRALVRFGGVEPIRERTRDEIRPAPVEDCIRDVRHGVRLLLRAPAFTVAALITLALGIGATSAIFSVVRTVMLEPLPYRDPERLVGVWETNRGATVRNVIAPANFVEWRERTRTDEHLGMVGGSSLALVIDGQAEAVGGFTMSADVFHALGVQPALGRAFTEEEDRGRNEPVIVLGHEFWQRRLGGRTDVLAMTITADGRPRHVIGVMPPGFTIVGQKGDFLIPAGRTYEQLREVLGRENAHGISPLRDGVS